jgi:transcriptional regulator with XRE-family HTH domain
MLTGIQIRAARAALGWSSEQLAQAAGVGQRTIMRFEQFDGVPPSRSATLIDLQNALEAAGIEFIGTPENRPGIRLERTSRKSD